MTDTIKLYQYLPWTYAEMSLSRWEMKATLPHYTNDPFEFMLSSDSDTMPKSCQERYNDMCLFCFSSSCTSAALWGHYGDAHKGVCLEFEFPLQGSLKEKNSGKGEITFAYLDVPVKHKKLYSKGFPIVLKVQYRNQRYQWVSPKVDDINTFGKRISIDCDFLATKDESWAFEKEYRIIDKITESSSVMDGNVFFDWPLNYLKSIYLGIRSKYNVPYVYSLLEKVKKENNSQIISDIEVRQMKSHQTSFEVIPDDMTQERIIFRANAQNWI